MEENKKNIEESINPENKTEESKDASSGKKKISIFVICAILVLALLVGGLTIHAVRSHNETDAVMEIELSDDTVVAIE